MTDHNYYGNSGDHWNAAFNRYDQEPDDDPIVLCKHSATHTCECGDTHCPICHSGFDDDRGEYSCPNCYKPYGVLMQLMITRVNRQEESQP